MTIEERAKRTVCLLVWTSAHPEESLPWLEDALGRGHRGRMRDLRAVQEALEAAVVEERAACLTAVEALKESEYQLPEGYWGGLSDAAHVIRRRGYADVGQEVAHMEQEAHAPTD